MRSKLVQYAYFKTRATLAKTNRKGLALAPEKMALANATAVRDVGFVLGLGLFVLLLGRAVRGLSFVSGRIEMVHTC